MNEKNGKIPLTNPIGKALEILLTGDFITATEALELGLINHVVPPSELMSKTMEIATKILANAPLAVRGMKAATLRGMDKPLTERLEIATQIYDGLQVRYTLADHFV